jgi:hypothetical protein
MAPGPWRVGAGRSNRHLAREAFLVVKPRTWHAFATWVQSMASEEPGVEGTGGAEPFFFVLPFN